MPGQRWWDRRGQGSSDDDQAARTAVARPAPPGWPDPGTPAYGDVSSQVQARTTGPALPDTALPGADVHGADVHGAGAPAARAMPLRQVSAPAIPLRGVVHLQDAGDAGIIHDSFAGTRGQSRRLEGFSLQFDPPVPGLSLQYMAHLQDLADTQWVSAGEFVGSRGQSRRLEGFAIRLTGPAAPGYTVMYMAHLQGTGDTGFCRDSQFCGTRGQSRSLEGMLVRVLPR
jgi:hypothetical protein